MDVDPPISDETIKQIQDDSTVASSEESLLGSFTTNALDKEEKGVLIRSSARVFKKMKLEMVHDKKHDDSHQPDPGLISPTSEIPTPIIHTTNNDKGIGDGDNKAPPPVRCSTRVVRKAKHETQQEVKGGKESKGDMKKEIRKWSNVEKIMFFEAVNEFGKDFESIQQYINSKLKKKGASDENMRSNQHVRTFFIRTFHEVSKHVKFADIVKKNVQELYGVINYGELHKKLDVITDKALMKLSELIYRGATCIRVKGRNIRIKTPMCRALIKLNQLDQKYEDIKLPNRVLVELKPKDMNAYLKVQCLAQNPRLRTTLPIQKRIGFLIQCLSRRWRSMEALNYEKALTSNPQTDDCVPPKEEIDEKMSFLVPPLRLSPPAEAKIELPSINISEYFTRQTICLTAYENRLGIDTYSEIKKSLLCKLKKPKKDSKVESCDHKNEQFKMEVVNEEVEVNHFDETEQDAALAEAVHNAVNTIISLSNFDRQQSENSESEDIPKPDIKPVVVISPEDQEQIKAIKKGWTEAASESLTVGEIYLMYGSDSKLVLEYSWDRPGNVEPEKAKRTAANFLEMWNESFTESWEMRQRTLSSSLMKLLSLAKYNFQPKQTKCTCGHVCHDKSSKNSIMGANNHEEMSATDTGSSQQSNNSSFKSPLLLPKDSNAQASSVFQQLNSIQRLRPKLGNKKGRRLVRKQLVVERKLPLMPNDSSGHQIVRMNIISQERSEDIKPELTTPVSGETSTSLQDIISNDDDENSGMNTVPPSPSRILKEGENDWINADVADYSLSSLLGHLETPTKTMGNMNSNMGTDISNEVDAQLQSMITESSMDFAATFADLAASVASDGKY